MPAQACVPGKDGAVAVAAANAVTNGYTTLSATAAADATIIAIASAAGIACPPASVIALGFNSEPSRHDFVRAHRGIAAANALCRAAQGCVNDGQRM